MWFVFPQVAGLGLSATSVRYAISSLDEARAYLEHPVLGPRLVECAAALAGLSGRTAEEILGAVDAMKLRSSMTLFARAAPDDAIFREVLDRYFGGVADERTDALLGGVWGRGPRPSPLGTASTGGRRRRPRAAGTSAT